MRGWLLVVPTVLALGILLALREPSDDTHTPTHETGETGDDKQVGAPRTATDPPAESSAERRERVLGIRARYQSTNVRFRVVDAVGKPVQSAEVLLEDPTRKHILDMPWTRVAEDGTHKQRIDARSHPRFFVRAAGFITRATKRIGARRNTSVDLYDVILDPAARLHGRVISKEDGPLTGFVHAFRLDREDEDGARLAQLAQAGPDFLLPGVPINEDGAYEFNRLPRGVYALLVITDQRHEQVFDGIRPSDGPGRDLVLRPDKGRVHARPLDPDNLPRAAQPTQKLKRLVVVRAPQGQRVTDVELRLRPEPWPHRADLLREDISVDVPTSQMQRFLAWQSAPAQRWVLSAKGVRDGKTIAYARVPVTEHPTLVVDLHPTRHTSGTVRDDDRNPVPYAQVTVAAFEPGLRQRLGWWCGDDAVRHHAIQEVHGQTDAKGRFEILGLDPTLRWQLGARTPRLTQTGDPRARDSHVAIYLEESSVLSGRLAFDGPECPALHVIAWPTSGSRSFPGRPRQGRVYADGYFRITGLRTGSYRIALHGARESTTVEGEQPVWLLTQEVFTGNQDIRATLSEGRVVRCRVRDAQGRPQPFTRVVVNRRYLDRHVLTDRNGEAVIGGLPRGRLTMRAYTDLGAQPIVVVDAETSNVMLTVRPR